MTSQEKVKAQHPRARAARYKTHGGSAYYLIWSGYSSVSRRLGEGKTASAAWVDAAAKMEARAAAAMAKDQS